MDASRWQAALGLLVLLCLNLAPPAAASPDLEATAGYRTADGRVRVVGYNDMDRMLTELNRVFHARRPDIEFELELTGTKHAPAALMDGRSLFAPMGAEFPQAALTEYRARLGNEPLGIRVAHASLSPQALSGPLALFVHRSNPLTRISLAELRIIFTSSGDITPLLTWGQLGLAADWPTRPIAPCGLNEGTALAVSMRKNALGDAPFVDSFKGFPQSSDVVHAVAENPEALCFAAYIRRSDDVRALAVSVRQDSPPIALDEENIVAGRYPLDRFLYIYLRQSTDGAIEPLALEYLDLVLSPEGQAIIGSGERAYLPLNPDERAAERKKLGLDP